MRWAHWFDAYQMGVYARNRMPKKGGKPSAYEQFYRREPGYKHMVPFGTVAYIERKKKNKKAISRSDPEPARVIGYPDDTPGWKFKIRGTARPYVTSHAIFDASRTPEDSALARNSDSDTGFVKETTGAEGFPLGGTDTEIRRAAMRYQTEIVHCSQPSEHRHPAAT